MKTVDAVAVVLALTITTTLNLTRATEVPADPAARFYPLVGNWKGNGQLSENGQTPAKLSLQFDCRKASAGAAVLCEMKASNDKMTLAETDLFGVDPVTGKGHWFAVTNAGETHDHLAEWTDAKTLKARYAWNQEGKKMEENVTLRISGTNTLEFRSAVTADGKEVGAFTGSLKR